MSIALCPSLKCGNRICLTCELAYSTTYRFSLKLFNVIIGPRDLLFLPFIYVHRILGRNGYSHAGEILQKVFNSIRLCMLISSDIFLQYYPMHIVVYSVELADLVV